ncbi:MAG: deoxyribodipyrimidine photo-lyase, partial [Chromatiales bacterium]
MTAAILWFRRDLRLDDNPALHAALKDCRQLIPLYIYHPGEKSPWADGAASRWWLHHSLAALDGELRKRGSRLLIRQGEPLTILQELAREQGIRQLYWNRLYEPAIIERDSQIKKTLAGAGIDCQSFNSA